MKPVRIQRQRSKGWKMPENTVYVGRPTKWGNPFPLSEFGPHLAVRKFRLRLVGLQAIGASSLAELRGKNLACWCPLNQLCHADVLLELANAE